MFGGGTLSRSKMDREIDDFVTKNWPMLLILGAGAAVWFSRDKILSEISRWMPVVVQVAQLLILGLLAVVVLQIIRRILLYQIERRRYRYVMIIPHVDDEITVDTVGRMIRQVHGAGRRPLERLFKGRDWYRLLAYRPEGKEERLRFYLAGPEDGINRVVQAFRSLYIHAEVYEQKMDEVPFPTWRAVGGRMVLKRKHLEATLSLARYTKDVLPTLLNATEEKTWVDVSFSPDNGHRLIKGIRKAEKAIKKRKKHSSGFGLDAFEKEEYRDLNRRFAGNEVAFQVAVSFASEYYPGVPVLKNLGNMVASIMADVNELRYRRLKHSVLKFPCPSYGKMTWTGSELANLLHLPKIKGDKKDKVEKKILYLDKGEEMLPKDLLSDGIGVGYARHPMKKDRLVRIAKEQMKKMGAITGKTGSGKSTVAMAIMESVMDEWLNDPENASGFSLFDPTPDLAIIALNRMLKAELDGKQVDWNKVHFIRFRHSQHPPALNLLHRFPNEDTQTVINSILSVIKSIIPGQAPQTERILKATIGTLLIDGKQTHNTLSIPMFLTNEIFRARVLSNLEGPEAKYYSHYWKHDVGEALDASIQPILNRLDLFRSTTYLKRMYGQSGFSLEIRKWMDEGHIVFYDLSDMESDDIQLTIGYIMNQYHRIVQQRPIGSKLHLAFIDEAHKVQVPILPKIVAEDRKYGLGLWPITQQITGQLDKALADALKEIGGNFFVCRQGPDSAKVLEDIMQKRFRAQYLQGLPDLVVAVQTQDKIDGKAQDVWCTIEVPPLDRYLPDGKVAIYGNEAMTKASNAWTYAKIKELEQTGKSIEEIDKEIDQFLYGKRGSKKEKVPLEKSEYSKDSIFNTLEKEKVTESVQSKPLNTPLLIKKQPETSNISIKEEQQAQIIPLFQKKQTKVVPETIKEEKPKIEKVVEESRQPEERKEQPEIQKSKKKEDGNKSIFDMLEREKT